jgi:hypothetical protein
MEGKSRSELKQPAGDSIWRFCGILKKSVELFNTIPGGEA